VSEQRREGRALVDGVGNWAKRRENQGEGSQIQKGCDYKFQEKRVREGEDVVIMTPSCDHLNRSTKKLKSRTTMHSSIKCNLEH